MGMASRRGIAVLISLVRLVFPLWVGIRSTFLGVAHAGLVADGAHDLNLSPLLIHGIAHGLAVDGKTLVLLGIGLIPGLKGAIQLGGIDAHQALADGVERRGDELACLVATAKPLEAFLAELIDPLLDALVAAHAGKDGGGRQGEKCR